ncbi:MAG: STY4528 family pathogenicity island replication protein [Enterobacterales bacterium endosymbiont of Blomia tropicalis]|uniref:STY4528 family pathogenicity island replication protein n=1 Tax=Mixta mediterraneensis TaxID=2758443 RepID=UPI0025A8A46B|nr:STY4528 family pathogenicity island replication protein [Mixta mediterraneensis]MDL4914892.1 STY4528 family pathogenicity island replication protein [Mixta mediterraneensis]
MSINRTPDDSLIAFTLGQMNARLAERTGAEKHTGATDVTNLRSGLLYMGNVHDSIPRRLLLDARLSPLDKTAWIMIRLYAQQNQGAVFPTYDELQLQLASPFNGKASRETVSRVLLMLRLTGWLSLCRRMRDDKGRVRGNIYAQHDEPLSARDAETLDPTWLDTVAMGCAHRNRTISQTAWSVLSDIQNDPTMRHQHSQMAAIAERLGAPQTPQQMAARVSLRAEHLRSSVTEPSKKSPGSATELSVKPGCKTPGSLSELSLKSATYGTSTQPNCNVRSFTQSVNKKTYVPELPAELQRSMAEDDQRQIAAQLQALPDDAARQVLESLGQTMARGSLNNPTGWLLTVIKRARNGEPYALAKSSGSASPAATDPTPRPSRVKSTGPVRQLVASREHVSTVVAKLRQQMTRAKQQP